MTTQDKKIQYLTMTGILAAMITLMTAYVCHIPIGTSGGYIHFGDALIYLGAVLLPKPYAIAAAVIGGGLADLLTAPMWAPATMLIKLLLVLPFTSKTPKLLNPRNLVALLVGGVITCLGYFLAEYFLFGTWAVFFASVFPNMIQATGSALFFVIFAGALEKVQFKNKIMKS
ncbi:MAG: TIGR04002 family protein [Lachnospiraceae bacterium]|nr:TIGR04002 family protein [Lachnospiraceae bacterium]